MKTRLILLLLACTVVMAIASVPVHAVGYYTFQTGAWGDKSSIGNTGVQATIQTAMQPVNPPDLENAFWVASNLQGGAFIQFGYTVTNGIFCSKGFTNNGQNSCSGEAKQFIASRPVWFWQYWPNLGVNNFYYAYGDSVGTNGTWNTYTIEPSQNDTWSFVLNGQPIDNLNVNVMPSASEAYMEAEKISSAPSTNPLGPVEFRNLEWFNGNTWQYVNSLTVLHACGTSVCVVNNPYGVEAVANNDIIAGSNEPVLTNMANLVEGGIAPASNSTSYLDSNVSLDNQTATNVSVDNTVRAPINETALILQDLNQSTLLQEEIEHTNPTQRQLNGSYDVTLIVPCMIDVTVDSVQASGPIVQLQLNQGTHTISVPNQIDVNGTVVQFAGWVDASGLVMGQSTITIDFAANLVMQASYEPVWGT